MKGEKTIVVAGDVMIDWNLSVDRDKIVALRSWADAGNVRRVAQLGGAWLLEDLIRNFGAKANSKRRYRTLGTDRPKLPSLPVEGIHQTYSVVMPASDDVLRVHEFLGVEKSDPMTPVKILKDDPKAIVVALLDSDLDFDRTPASWPLAIKGDQHPWVILKTSVPDFQQDLWQHLSEKHNDRLIVVMTVEDLRRKEIQLIRRLSWERTAQDLVRELKKSPALQALRKCRYLIVSLGPAGAMLFPRDEGDEDAQLIFDPAIMENEWAPEKKPTGGMIGYSTILAAAVAHEIMIHPEFPQLADALPRGIAGMRALFENGFGPSQQQSKENQSLEVDLGKIAKAALERRKIVSTVRVPQGTSRSWTILEERLKRSAKNFPSGKVEDALYELAARVAVYGPEQALSDVPQLSIGKLFTVDREEIEAYRSIKLLLTEYVQRTPSEPLSIAVFGSPGSGKSFGVKEIVLSIDSKKKITPLTFNLTQFASATDLRGAFHQVRDVSLRGEIPLVFWDEFDTSYGVQQLGWLRYFISPMQDGLFQEDQLTHPIGSSIFVFAGGTATSKDDFVKPPVTGETQMTEAERKALKVPDFISRLKGFLNVTGPNRRDSSGDPHYLIRRAVVLRSMLLRHFPDLFRKDPDKSLKDGRRSILRIAPGVLHGFLNTGRYVHGARSLESVIAMSALGGRKRFLSSSLPPEAQLTLHVELPFEQFYERSFIDDVERLERQAERAHKAFYDTKTEPADSKLRWKYADIRDDKRRKHNLLVDYEKLPEDAREANRASVRMIPMKVLRVGYAVVPAGTGKAASLDYDIERLAEIEHEIWVKRKREAGYVHGPEATESPKQSPYLVRWKELDNEWKEVDRAMIRAIPDILDMAEYVLIKESELQFFRAGRRSR